MYLNGLGVPKDYQQALVWFQKAAEQGLSSAQFTLGTMYANSEGVPKDDGQAVIWFRKAVEQNYAAAQYNLGKMYQDGRGVPKDAAQAIFWYRKAADQNYAYDGHDEGYGDRFWCKETSSKCRYRLHRNPNPSNLRDFIDFDEFDPKSISFRHNSFLNAIFIQHDTEMLFSSFMNLNLERLRRGWALTYSKYCSGKEKPF
jgi:TPR repeat protein